MKDYKIYIRIPCAVHKEVYVKAENKKEAKELARLDFAVTTKGRKAKMPISDESYVSDFSGDFGEEYNRSDAIVLDKLPNYLIDN